MCNEGATNFIARQGCTVRSGHVFFASKWYTNFLHHLFVAHMGPLSVYTCKRFQIPSSSTAKFQQILKRNRDSKTHNLPNIECLHDFNIFYISYYIKKTFEKCVQKYINLFKKREIELVGPTKYVAFSFGFIASIGSGIKRWYLSVAYIINQKPLSETQSFQEDNFFPDTLLMHISYYKHQISSNIFFKSNNPTVITLTEIAITWHKNYCPKQLGLYTYVNPWWVLTILNWSVCEISPIFCLF